MKPVRQTTLAWGIAGVFTKCPQVLVVWVIWVGVSWMVLEEVSLLWFSVLLLHIYTFRWICLVNTYKHSHTKLYVYMYLLWAMSAYMYPLAVSDVHLEVRVRGFLATITCQLVFTLPYGNHYNSHHHSYFLCSIPSNSTLNSCTVSCGIRRSRIELPHAHAADNRVSDHCYCCQHWQRWHDLRWSLLLQFACFIWPSNYIVAIICDHIQVRSVQIHSMEENMLYNNQVAGLLFFIWSLIDAVIL